MAERIGIFGGTFDPIHVGHLVAAVNARHDLALDRVVLMVANVPVAESRGTQSDTGRGPFRNGQSGGRWSAQESKRAGWRSTGAGLRTRRTRSLKWRLCYPEAELFVIVGWDVSAELGTWERLNEVRDLASLVVVNRPGTPPPVGLSQQGWRLEEVAVPNLEISSTDLRARAMTGRPLDYLIPGPAVRVIRERGLYSGGG